MATHTPTRSRPSALRLAFWRAAAGATEVILRNRERLLAARPYVILLAGGLLAYVIGYHVGLKAFGPLP
jgi:hypothetical protein